MSKEVEKGTAFTSDVVGYLRDALGDDRIERRALCGANDRGDVAGVWLRGKRVVLECKNRKRMELSEWVDEAEVERRNDGAGYGFVVHKRRGCGKAKMGETYVTCTLETLAAIIVGGRELLGYDREDRPSGRYLLFERGIDEDG